MREHILRLLIELGVINQDNMHQDAAYAGEVEKALDYVMTRVYMTIYPSLKARELLPTSNEAPSGAETITYKQWSEFGMAQILANYADDLPLIDALAEDVTAKIKGIGAAYQFSIQDIRAAAMSGSRLPEMRAQAARRATEKKIDDIAATGDSTYGLTGLANNSNVPLITPDTGTWASATAAQITADLNKLVNSIVTLTKEEITPTDILLDVVRFTRINSLPMSTTGDTSKSVLKNFLETNPYIKSIKSWHKLSTADAAGTGPRAVCYAKDPMVASLEIPQEYEQFPPQAKNLSFVVPCHARCAGVIMPYPMAVAYMDGL